MTRAGVLALTLGFVVSSLVLSPWPAAARAGDGIVFQEYLVTLDAPPRAAGRDRRVDWKAAAGEISRQAEELAAGDRAVLREVWPSLGIFLVAATEGQARSLAARPGVVRVDPNREVEPSLIKHCGDLTAPFVLANSYNATSPQTISCWDPSWTCSDNWALDRIDQHTGDQSQHTLDSRFTFGPTGNGVHIYVVDTGVASNHSEFLGTNGQPRIGNGINVHENGPWWDTYDQCSLGHGTLVASVAAGRRFGVAKKATIHPVRVAASCTSTTSRLISALSWVTLNRQLPAVVVLSWNMDSEMSALDDAVRRTVRDYGISVVNSAGNANQDARSSSPSGLPEAIVVGGVDWVGNRRWGSDAPFCHSNGCGSNGGPTVDLFAPAVNILGAMGTGEGTYACESTGTSFAAPLAAGVAAQYLELNPTATPAMVESALVQRATVGVITGDLFGAPNRLLFSY